MAQVDAKITLGHRSGITHTCVGVVQMACGKR